MTARANSLTERVTAPLGSGDGRWSMSTGDVRPFLEGMRGLRYNVVSLLATAGVRRAVLDDPDARLSCETLGRILTLAQQQHFTPNIGVELARLTPLGSYPLLDYLVATSEDVANGVKQLARYLRLTGNPTRISAHEQKDGSIQVRIENAPSPFGVEYTLALMVLHFRTETEDRFAIEYVSVSHAPDDEAAFARALGCEVKPCATWDGLVVPRETWRRPLRRRDPLLRQFLETQADQVLARLPPRTGIAHDVQRALTQSLDAGSTRMGTFARRLAMSARTLQRRLAAEGLSYQQVLDSARREASARYLKESTLSIGEVAYLVGYSEPAPFHRAFKRWYGMTPETFRQSHRRRPA